MLDLHSHILPDVDDGPADWAGTLEMLSLAEAHGTNTIVATPHTHSAWYRSECAGTLIPDLVDEAQRRARSAGLSIDVCAGQECFYDVELVTDLNQGRWLPLGQSRTVLLELPFAMWPAVTEQLIYELQLAGYTVLLAHPERYKAVQKNPNLIFGLVERGVYTQITSAAITGRLGRSPQRTARTLLEHGLGHIIASDGHNVRGRPPMLDVALSVASGWIGAEAAEQMVTQTPQALLDDRLPTPFLSPRVVGRSGRRSARRFLNIFG